MNRRKIRKYRSSRRNSGVKFAGILGIMVVAVICGYMTARFIIAPLLGYDTEVLKLDFPSKLTSFLDRGDDGEDSADDDSRDADSEETADTGSEDGGSDDVGSDDGGGKTASGGSGSEGDSGYALQFGLFTTKDRAQDLVDDLDADGIDAKIRKVDGKYKVTSPLVDTKDEAVELLKATKTDRVKDVFITVVE